MAIEIGTIYDSGASSYTGDRHTQFESYLGHPTTYARIFFTPAESSPNPPGGKWAVVTAAINAGYWVHISPKSTLSWTQVATTSTDIAHWQAVGDWMAQFPPHSPHPHIFTFHHEMDNDGPSGNDTTDGANFQGAFNRVAAIIKARAPDWLTCCVYSLGTFTQVSNGELLHGGPYLWWPSESQVCGHDYYFRRTQTVGYADADSVIADAPPSRLYVTANGRIGSSLFAAEQGVPLLVPEFGINVKDPADTGSVAASQAERASIVQQYMDAWKANAPNLWGINYYDRGSPSGFRPYAIAGGSPEPVCNPDLPTLAAFDSVSPSVVGPPPPRLLQTQTLINSTADGVTYVGQPFNLGPNELVMFWVETDLSGTGSVPPPPNLNIVATVGTAPIVSRLTDNAWANTTTIRGLLSVFVAKTGSAGAYGCTATLTAGTFVGGATVVLERIRGADISGAVSAALVRVQANSGTGTSLLATLTAPADPRNSLHQVVVHNASELTTPRTDLVESVDVSRTAPNLSLATAHSTVDTGFITAVGASWTSSVAAGMLAAEINAGAPLSGIELGSTTATIATMQTMLGRSVDIQRVEVLDSAALLTTTTGGWAEAAAADAAGRATWISAFMGPFTYSQVLAGNINGNLAGYATFLGAFTHPGVFTYCADADRLTTRGTASQFISAVSTVIAQMRPLMPGWRFAVLLSDDIFRKYKPAPWFVNTTDTEDNWTTAQADILAVNAFNYKGATTGYAVPAASTYPDQTPAAFFDGMYNWSIRHGKTLCLGGFGCAVDNPSTDPNGHAERAAWIEGVMAYMKGHVEIVCYRDTDSLNGTPNWRITGGVKAAEQDSVDAFKSAAALAAITKFHTTTAIIKKLAITKTQTTTAIVRKTLTRTQTSDAILRPTTAVTASTDAIISRAGVTVSHTSDTYIEPRVFIEHLTSASGSGVSTVVIG